MSNRIFLSFFVVISLLACSNTPPDVIKGDSTSETQVFSDKIVELAPDGWEMYDEVLVFTAENLYKHINGRAELYLAYDVKSLTTATFEKKSNIGEFMELSIYDMDTVTNGFGIFSVERPRDETALDLGRASYRSGSNIFIWKGKFYTTIVTSDSSDKLLPLSIEIARKAMAFLSDSKEPVWGLTALPQKNLIPDSVKYFRVDALGLDFMQNTYTAKYRKDDLEITAFLSQQNSLESAGDVVVHYAKYASQYGRGSQSLNKGGIEFVFCDMNGSFDVIFQKGLIVGGVQSVTNRSTALEAAAELWAQINSE